MKYDTLKEMHKYYDDFSVFSFYDDYKDEYTIFDFLKYLPYYVFGKIYYKTQFFIEKHNLKKLIIIAKKEAQ